MKSVAGRVSTDPGVMVLGERCMPLMHLQPLSNTCRSKHEKIFTAGLVFNCIKLFCPLFLRPVLRH